MNGNNEKDRIETFEYIVTETRVARVRVDAKNKINASRAICEALNQGVLFPVKLDSEAVIKDDSNITNIESIEKKPAITIDIENKTVNIPFKNEDDETEIKTMELFNQSSPNQSQEEWEDEGNFDFDNYQYRIKPEETYRPYKNTDEMIADYEAKIMARFDFEPTDFDMPLIWVKNNTSGIKYLITSYASVSVGITDTYVSVQELFDKYTYLDGTLIGVKE